MRDNTQRDPDFRQRRGIAPWLLLYGKGIAMGMGDSVPGVSGGTIAVITHIYDELVHAIKSVDATALRLVLNGVFGKGASPRSASIKESLMQAWGHINGNFLAVLALGLLSGLLVSANTVLYLLEHEFQVLMGFFIGLVLASCWILGRQLPWWDYRHCLGAAFGILLVAALAQLPPVDVQPSPAYLFMAGAIAICAMLLPGLSGAFILILLGAYEPALRALTELQWLNMAVFMAGCGVGILSFSRLLDWLLHHYRQMSYSVIVGLLLGSLWVLWPWQPQYQAATGDAPRLLFTAVAALGGLITVLLLEHLSALHAKAQAD